ncbi:MAG: hypothetical protein RML12_01830 [Xanthomonadales bacterium]|nr:hypothetical protein [Xanthomonadales bacterium]
MRSPLAPICLLLAALLAAAPLSAQTSLAQLGEPVHQGFDGLAGSGSNLPWSDNATVPGWYANRPDYSTGNGSSTAGALYSYRRERQRRARAGLAGLGEHRRGDLRLAPGQQHRRDRHRAARGLRRRAVAGGQRQRPDPVLRVPGRGAGGDHRRRRARDRLGLLLRARFRERGQHRRRHAQR